MRPAPSLALFFMRLWRRSAKETPRAAIRDTLGMTSKVCTSPPSELTSATLGKVRNAGRIIQSSTRRFSARLKASPSSVNMTMSLSGVVIGARPPVTPWGNSGRMPASRSATCCRAQYRLTPSVNSTVMSVMPYFETERTTRLLGMLSSSSSIGRTTRCSISSGVIPGLLRMILAWIGEISGNASIGRLSQAWMPAPIRTRASMMVRPRWRSTKPNRRATINVQTAEEPAAMRHRLWPLCCRRSVAR